MSRTVYKSIIGWLMIGLSTLAWASAPPPEPGPSAMLESTSQTLLKHLKNAQRSTTEIERAVKRFVLPIVAVDDMSRAVLGRSARHVTPKQLAEFKKYFTRMVVRTYSAALSNYENETVVYHPVRALPEQSARFVIVYSEIRRNDGSPSIHVNYRLKPKKVGWKVVDFSVDGISMVDNYREQFKGILAQQGMGGLLAQLRQRG